MKVPLSLLALALPAVLTHCGPEGMLNPTAEVPPQPVIPVGPETSVIRDLRGSRLTYMDNHGENVYRLSKLGTYTYTSLSRNGKNTEERQGLYTYKQTGKKTGKIVFDLTDTWNLTFISPHRATAKNDGDKRSYTFEFEWQ